MKRFLFLSILAASLLGLALFLTVTAVPAGEGRQFEHDLIVVRAHFDDPSLVADLAAWKEPWEVHYDKGYLVVGVTAAEYAALEEAGFRLEIDARRTAEANAPRQPLPNQGGGIPGFPCYRTVEETFASAAQLAADYPDLAEWTDVGDSWEKTAAGGLPGYDMFVLRLTNEATPGPKPKLFAMSAIHAREYTTAELNTRFAEYLINNYGLDADATWLLDHHELHLLLMTNPDGRKHAEAGQFWRKNTNENYCGPTSPSRGADLNRNFEFQWGCCGGSSSNECSETYRGPAPASEPEVQAVQDYVSANFPDQRDDPLPAPAPITATGVFLDIHSYSELVLWPWGFTQDPAPNSVQLQTLGRKFAYFNGYYPEQAIGLYVTDGTTDDFAYGELGLAAYTFELGTAFFQSCATFESTILPDNLPALLYAAKVSRTPYITPAGPDALELALSNSPAEPGQVVTLTATINDSRFSNDNGTEPVQDVAAAEYYIDTPPWITTTTPISIPLAAADGAFDESIEAVVGAVDTAGLANGRHTLFVRGQDANGAWGAFSAAFLYILDPSAAPHFQGTVTAADTGLPLAAEVAADTFTTLTDPATGVYDLLVISGTYDLTATPLTPGYGPATAENLTIADGQVVVQDFQLDPMCDAFADDVEAGNLGWTADPPWAITDEASHSPTHSWTDSPGVTYGSNLEISLTSPELDLSEFTGLELTFWHICDTEADYDYCIVEVSADGGATWDELASYDGSSTQWEEVTLDASTLDGAAAAHVRFHLSTDFTVNDDGWHVDDIRLSGGGPACVSLIPPAASFSSSSPDFLGETTVFTNTSTGSELTFAWDFGDGGPVVTDTSPSHAYAAAGLYTVTLTATNSLGSDVATGQVEISADEPPVIYWLYTPAILYDD
ncbi:MAG: M14 family zinc carboxypeptidase [Candidatus Promineifilaceae bacterium]